MKYPVYIITYLDYYLLYNHILDKIYSLNFLIFLCFKLINEL